MTETYHPIAGGPAVTDTQAQEYDHRWLLVDTENRWLTTARAPRLEGLKLALRLGYLVIRAEGMLRLDVPLDVIEDDPSVERQVMVGEQTVRVVDEGDLAAAWFTEWLGQECRFMKVHPEADAVLWVA